VNLLPDYGLKLTPKHYAYLKISEGCNHRCSFCIIPSMRGDLVSRPVDDVLREAEKLVRGGVKELLVVSQDTSAYGVDVKYAKRAAQQAQTERAWAPDAAMGTAAASPGGLGQRLLCIGIGAAGAVSGLIVVARPGGALLPLVAAVRVVCAYDCARLMTATTVS